MCCNIRLTRIAIFPVNKDSNAVPPLLLKVTKVIKVTHSPVDFVTVGYNSSMPKRRNDDDRPATKGDLKAAINPLRTGIADLKTDVSDLKTDVSGLKTEGASLKQTVTRIDTALQNQALEIIGLRRDVDDIKENMVTKKDHEMVINKIDGLATLMERTPLKLDQGISYS